MCFRRLTAKCDVWGSRSSFAGESSLLERAWLGVSWRAVLGASKDVFIFRVKHIHYACTDWHWRWRHCDRLKCQEFLATGEASYGGRIESTQHKFRDSPIVIDDKKLSTWIQLSARPSSAWCRYQIFKNSVGYTCINAVTWQSENGYWTLLTIFNKSL